MVDSDLAAAAMAAEVGEDHELTRLFRSRGQIENGGEPVPIHVIIRVRIAMASSASGAQGRQQWHSLELCLPLAGESAPAATGYYVGPWQNRNLFKALSHAIQTFFRDRRAPYPVERTLLVSGILDSAMDSRQQAENRSTRRNSTGRTPHEIIVRCANMGATWKIITEAVPARGIEPVGIN